MVIMLALLCCCSGDPELGLCDGVDLQTSAESCGQCGYACAAHEICLDGQCTCAGRRCPDGFACCGAACFDLQGDPSACGACDASCAPGERCVQGACAP